MLESQIVDFKLGAGEWSQISRKVNVKSVSHVQLFETQWTVAY